MGVVMRCPSWVELHESYIDGTSAAAMAGVKAKVVAARNAAVARVFRLMFMVRRCAENLGIRCQRDAGSLREWWRAPSRGPCSSGDVVMCDAGIVCDDAHSAGNRQVIHGVTV